MNEVDFQTTDSPVTPTVLNNSENINPPKLLVQTPNAINVIICNGSDLRHLGSESPKITIVSAKIIVVGGYVCNLYD